ncbi:magnesium chelatase subunit D family protein [Nocardioides cavernaquae]|uniref:Mg-protoporphyrin IX chelatase n=1 Tax=Nocardioides cavernaquae TaxID=2321396 RepID=A0A3A5H6R5_9ACTN|nr:magnesium chelatase subunit D family protein [Nocardioides cavernaquae]RJS45558.1 VWA domain-containing protein [Nocardioides cavernaquae]
MSDSTVFPFSAVVGQDDLGLALSLAVVSPAIGGVLVRGEKGTAKSTMVRGLASVLPPLSVIDGCRFSCAPDAPDLSCPDVAVHGSVVVERPVALVELPVGASEDRVVGSLHLDKLVASGEVAFEPGLLARAHRGLLYVDEVNLLPDHLVDSLLDAAAMGRARVEREAVSVTHEARFVLVGTMNPEEGELRPQLLDRFGLAVDVAASRDPESRVEVIRSRMAFEADPEAFVAKHGPADADVAARISAAQTLLPSVELPDEVLLQIATLCAAYDVDGLRGDLVTARTAVAHAAWCGRTVVTAEDVRVAARLALPHRRRRNPFDSHDSGADLEELLDEHAPESPDDEPDPDPTDPDAGPDGGPEGGPDGGDEGSPEGSPATSTSVEAPDSSTDVELPQNPPQSSAPQPPEAREPKDRGTDLSNDAAERTREVAGTPYAARLLTVDRVGQGVTGRRSTAITAVGRHLRAVPLKNPQGQGLSVTGTLLASAVDQSTPGVSLRPEHLRRSLKEGKEGNLVVFVVDTSGSMGAARRVKEIKTAVVSLLLDAYQRRDKVAVVTFGGDKATVALEPTSSVDRAERMLGDVPTGGRTPLAEALVAAEQVVRRERARDPQRRPLVVLVTDGRATSGKGALSRAQRTADLLGTHGTPWVVVDAEDQRAVVRLGLAQDLAVRLGADHLPLGEVAASTLKNIVNEKKGAA